jgi:hypothetical protein
MKWSEDFYEIIWKAVRMMEDCLRETVGNFVPCTRNVNNREMQFPGRYSPIRINALVLLILAEALRTDSGVVALVSFFIPESSGEFYTGVFLLLSFCCPCRRHFLNKLLEEFSAVSFLHF